MRSPRVLDVELESEDEDAIIERRRQLRQAIVQKYKVQLPQTEMSSLATTPARSDTSGEDSDTVGNEATKDLEETLHQEEMKRQQEEAEGRGSSVGVVKGEVVSKLELVQKKTSLQAMKAAVRNADMFSEEDTLFGEKKYLVREHC